MGISWNFSMLNGEIASVQYKLPYKYMDEASKSGDFSIWLRTVDEVRNYFMLI